MLARRRPGFSQTTSFNGKKNDGPASLEMWRFKQLERESTMLRKLVPYLPVQHLEMLQDVIRGKNVGSLRKREPVDVVCGGCPSDVCLRSP
ncbi:transposase [Azorhizobium caulinodans ORS 571]|uniref:Transposase n=1 Tax=Azorhizobium caulinodans (strain ATCC 43989 / DSM 5975 / JCM 20966 / LMG 6465 / NBRC 14845 / NCIMB 13405 / ORS 571) TaxID=438753 RepID=A8I0T4_AZOC5|nr:transposase [Azorhizobium caulinodans]BAF87292.1 transposase [Azorhizobium caulinodans ORS 571]